MITIDKCKFEQAGQFYKGEKKFGIDINNIFLNGKSRPDIDCFQSQILQ